MKKYIDITEFNHVQKELGDFKKLYYLMNKKYATLRDHMLKLGIEKEDTLICEFMHLTEEEQEKAMDTTTRSLNYRINYDYR